MIRSARPFSFVLERSQLAQFLFESAAIRAEDLVIDGTGHRVQPKPGR